MRLVLVAYAGVPKETTAVTAVAMDGLAVVAAGLRVRASKPGSDRSGQGADCNYSKDTEEERLGELGALLDGGTGGGGRHD
jgi:hypothetical protein